MAIVPHILLATVAILSAAATATIINNIDTDDLHLLAHHWSQFQSKYNKSYADPAEATVRLQIFADNLRLIEAHNRDYDRGATTYRMGVNRRSDRHQHEVLAPRKNRPLHNVTLDDAVPAQQSFDRSGWTAPKSLNWTAHGAVTPVRDQGVCGSCWAFGSLGALEGQHFLKYDRLVSLSEQNLVDCVYEDGCDGGFMQDAFEYVRNNKGVDTDAMYPYRGSLGDKCRYKSKYSGATCKGYKLLPKNDENALRWAVAKHGPIAVNILALTSFQNYESGIYYDRKCHATFEKTNHVVLLVGYGKDRGTGEEYWLLKNSYGIEWGENGYMRMARNRKNQCCIACETAYALV